MLLVVNDMRTSALLRLLLLPLGLLKKIFELAVDGSRDISNGLRFKGAKIEPGCCINQQSKIATQCHIFENVLFLNSTIEPYSYIGRNSVIQNAHIGAFCSIANEVFIGLGAHPIDSFSTSPVFYRVHNPLGLNLVERNSDFTEYQKIHIGNDVWIGARATVLDGVSIGHGAVVGTGSVVTKDVPPYAVVVGCPAKIVKYRLPEDQIEKLISIKWWNLPVRDIKERMKNYCDN